MAATLCQECGSSVDVPDEYLNQSVKCGGCEKVFIALPLAEARRKLDEQNSAEPLSEPTYYFRLDGKMLCAGSVRELAANKYLLQTDAVRMEAVPRSGGNPVPLTSLIDFTKPWRTTLPAGRSPLELPIAKPGLFDLPAGKPLNAQWNADYYVRMAGNSKNYPLQPLRKLLQQPPFPAEDYWKIEVKNSHFSGPYVPLTSLIDLSEGWPHAAESVGQPAAPRPATTSSASKLAAAPPAAAPQIPVGEAPGTEGLSFYAMVVACIGTVAGLFLIAAAAEAKSTTLGISGIGVIVASILQASAILLFCRLCRDVHAVRRENQQILEQLKKLEPQH